MPFAFCIIHFLFGTGNGLSIQHRCVTPLYDLFQLATNFYAEYILTSLGEIPIAHNVVVAYYLTTPFISEINKERKIDL